LPKFENLRDEVISYFTSRFGVAREVLEELTYTERGGEEVWATSAPTPAGIMSSRPAGVRILRRMPRGFKPTTVFLCILGEEITASRMEIEDESVMRRLLLGQPIACALGDGYFAISFRGDVLGCGVAKDKKARALIPTQKRRVLLGCLESESALTDKHHQENGQL